MRAWGIFVKLEYYQKQNLIVGVDEKFGTRTCLALQNTKGHCVKANDLSHYSTGHTSHHCSTDQPFESVRSTRDR